MYTTTQEFADENGMTFFEVSARNGANVELAVTNMVARIWKTIRHPETSEPTGVRHIKQHTDIYYYYSLDLVACNY